MVQIHVILSGYPFSFLLLHSCSTMHVNKAKIWCEREFENQVVCLNKLIKIANKAEQDWVSGGVTFEIDHVEKYIVLLF